MLMALSFLFRSGKNPGCYGNFFIVIVIPGQQSGERLVDHWSAGLIFWVVSSLLIYKIDLRVSNPLPSTSLLNLPRIAKTN